MRHRLLALVAAFALPVALVAADFDAASATNQLGLDLYRQLSQGKSDTNLVLSPYSITTALALAYTGSGGATRTEMARVLHFPADDLVLQSSLTSLRSDLERATSDSMSAVERVKRGGGSSDIIELRIANRLFAQSGYAFRETFLGRMQDGYGVSLKPLDFRQNASSARHTINRWVEDQTHDKISDLIPEGSVSADARLVLVNALYLKAPWETPFEPAQTQPAPFYVRGIEAQSIPTMSTERYLGYRHADGFTTVVLPYLGDELQFVIFLPDDRRDIDAVATRLTTRYLKSSPQLGENDHGAHVRLWLPKFRLTGSTMPLGAVLRSLGMKAAFDRPAGSADFSRIAARRPDDYLAISEMFHQTFLSLDEQGTEAAAATAVETISLGSSSPPEPIEVRVDHPFLFAIQHRTTGLCLFLGRVTDPR